MDVGRKNTFELYKSGLGIGGNFISGFYGVPYEIAQNIKSTKYEQLDGK